MVSPTPTTDLSVVDYELEEEEVVVPLAAAIRSIPLLPTLDDRIGAPRMELPVPAVNKVARVVVSYVTCDIYCAADSVESASIW